MVRTLTHSAKICCYLIQIILSDSVHIFFYKEQLRSKHSSCYTWLCIKNTRKVKQNEYNKIKFKSILQWYFLSLLLKVVLRKPSPRMMFSCSEKSISAQKKPSRVVLKKRCFESIQQIYRRTPMSKCDFNKISKQLY